MTAGRTVNSQSHHWCTPPKYVNAINLFFNNNIELDPCTNNQSIIDAKIKYILPDKDGLQESWNYKTIFVNPPYGSDRIRKTTIKNWLKLCKEANEKYNSEILALIPVATNTSHWKNYIYNKASAVCFLFDTRLKFLINGTTENKGSPMACAMIYWGNDFDRFKLIFSEYGYVVKL